MGRRNRQDKPGAWHHVTNTAVGKRPLFEDERDARSFLARVVRQVRMRRIQVHAWCLMTTHFHLLVRSPIGELSEGMRRLQNEYSRWFNRRHQRVGTLFGGRYWSAIVRTDRYRETLIRYIDDNPVSGGIVDHPCDYRWASARQYAQGRAPLWLERSVVERLAMSRHPHEESPTAAYVKFASRRISSGARTVIEMRTATVSPEDDGLDELFAAAPEEVRDWMRRSALRADGQSVGAVVSDVSSVCASVRSAREQRGPWTETRAHYELDRWQMLEALLLRTMTGATLRSAAAALCCSPQMVARRENRARAVLESGDAEFSERLATVGADAFRRCHRLEEGDPG